MIWTKFLGGSCALLVSALAVAACGSTTGSPLSGGQAPASSLPAGGGTQAPVAHAPDPCSLVTDAEAGSALGGPAMHAAEGSRDASDGGIVVTENRCSYQLVTSDQLGHAIQVAVYAGADRNYFNQHISGPAISGLGDAATGDTIHVYVFSKGTMLQIYGSLAADDGLQQVARVAIAKL